MVQKPFVTHVAQFAFEFTHDVLTLPVEEQRPHVLGHFCVISVKYAALLQSPTFVAQFVATSEHVGVTVVLTEVVEQK